MEPNILTGVLESVPIGLVTEHPQNPNRNELPPIIDSIEKVGFYGAIQVQRSTGYIVTGNHRYKAAVATGMKEVPVIYLDVDDDEAIRIMLNDNRVAEGGTQDQDMVDALLAEWGEGENQNFDTISGEQGGGAGIGMGIGGDDDEDEEPDFADREPQGKIDRSDDPEVGRRVISLTYTSDQHKIAMAGIDRLRERHESPSNGEAVLAHLREVLA